MARGHSADGSSDRSRPNGKRLVWRVFVALSVATILSMHGRAIQKMSSTASWSSLSSSPHAALREGWSLPSPGVDARSNHTVTTQQGSPQSLPLSSFSSKLRDMPSTKNNTSTNIHISANSSSIISNQGNAAPWRSSRVLPEWMKDYFAWHQSTLQKLNADNWKQYSYLVVRCLHLDRKCGGGADRLKSLPIMILLAHKLQRLLFYKWEKPASLTEFLVPPPEDGLDWRWPPKNISALSQHKFDRRPTIFMGGEMNWHLNYTDPNPNNQLAYEPRALIQISSVLYQSHTHGSVQYDFFRNEAEASYEEVFRDVWNSVFVLAPRVQARLNARMREMGLVENEYHAVHLRSQYIHKMKDKSLKQYAANTVNCLTQLLHDRGMNDPNNATIFVTSDGPVAVRAAMDHGHHLGLTHMIQKPANASEPILHLDRGEKFLSQKPPEWTHDPDPSGYYDTFVDLYVLSKAKCIAFSKGNYGRWSNFMSSDISCYYDTGDEKWPKHNWNSSSCIGKST